MCRILSLGEFLKEVKIVEDCIFCKIVKGEIPSDKVYEDDLVLAFNDLTPQAPTHILVIPKIHIASANDIRDENSNIIGHIFSVISKIAKEKGFASDGYRVVNNCGNDGGQTVGHIHFHLLAERQLQWPPG